LLALNNSLGSNLVLFWLATIVLGGAAGCKLIPWLARLFFCYPKQQAA
jgi:hypothetical protein